MSAESASRLDPRRRRRVTTALFLVTALGAFESTVVATAMPTIVADLRGLDLYSWVFSIFLLGSTVAMPVYGRLADLWGRRRLLLGGIALFTTGSLLCAVAPSMGVLVAARALQGLGAGGLVPLSLTVAGDLYTLEERARVQGYFSSVWGLASVVGPLAGAFLTIRFGWRSIFVAVLPLALIAAVLVATQLVEPRRAPAAGREPLFPRGLLTDRATAAPYLAGLLLGTTIYGVTAWVPLFVQGARGGTAGAAGAVITPLILCWAVSAVAAARALPRAGFRRTALAGALLVVAGQAGLLVAARADLGVAASSVACAVVGLGLGPSALAQLLAVQHVVSESRRGVATSLVPFSRTVGGSIGVWALGLLLASGLGEHGSSALAGTGVGAPVSAAARLALERALVPVFAAMLALAVVNLAVAARYPGVPRRPGG